MITASLYFASIGILNRPVLSRYLMMFVPVVIFSTASIIFLIHNRRRIHNITFPVIILSLLPLTQFVYLSVLVRPDPANDLRSAIAAGLAALALNAGIDLLFVNYIRRSNRLWGIEKENEMKANLQDMDKRFYEVTDIELKKTESVKAEIKSKLEELNKILETSDKDRDKGARSILDDIGGKIDKVKNIRYCADPTVNMLLNLKKQRADSKGVTIDINAFVPEVIGMNELDLSSVISNLTDNAIRAAEESGDAGKVPYVKIGIGYENGIITVRTENSTLIDRNIKDISDLKTTKNNRDLTHGYGLKIIQNIAARYRGNMIIDIKDHVSVIVVTMKCREDNI